MDINQPFYTEEKGMFFLHKPEFMGSTGGDKFSLHTFVGGLPAVVGEYKTLQELQVASLLMFKVEAKKTNHR